MLNGKQQKKAKQVKKASTKFSCIRTEDGLHVIQVRQKNRFCQVITDLSSELEHFTKRAEKRFMEHIAQKKVKRLSGKERLI